MNPRVAAIEPSIIRALAAKRRLGSIDLGLGEPTLLPDVKLFEAATAWVAEHGCRYTSNAGDEATRAAIAAHYAYPGMSEAANVCLTTGSQEAVYVAIKALLDPRRDELLVVEPAFPAYAKVAQLEGIAVRRVGMEAASDFAFEVERVLAALTPATKMIVLCSPCNPTGRTIGESFAARLGAALAKRPQPVYVLHDEIYRELTYVENAGWVAWHHPHTIVVNSLSKSNALTGMRLGWALAPRPAIDALVKTHAWATSSANAFGQRIALEIFATPGMLQAHAPWYRTQRASVLAVLAKHDFRFIVPEGAFYVCVRLPQGDDDVAFAHRLADEFDVIAIPGSAFGESLAGWLRLSWVAPASDFDEGLARITAAARSKRFGC